MEWAAEIGQDKNKNGEAVSASEEQTSSNHSRRAQDAQDFTFTLDEAAGVSSRWPLVGRSNVKNGCGCDACAKVVAAAPTQVSTERRGRIEESHLYGRVEGTLTHARRK